MRDYFSTKERELEAVYTASKLPHGPDEAIIKQLLLDCLEQHFGSISDCVVSVDPAVRALQEMEEVLSRYRQQQAKAQ